MDGVIYNKDKEEILKKISSADFIISDFDGTDVRSPLKTAALKYCANLSNIVGRPELMTWGIKGAISRYVLDGKDAESRLWEEFSSILGEDEMNSMIDSLCNGFDGNQKSIDKYFYQGVKDFYKLFPSTEKFYLSRNFENILDVFGSEIGIPESNIFSVEHSKGAGLVDIVEQNKKSGAFGGIYLFRGDSGSDDEVIDVANYYKGKDVIDDYVAIAIGNSSHSKKQDIDVISPTDQRNFVRDIAKYRSSQTD